MTGRWKIAREALRNRHPNPPLHLQTGQARTANGGNAENISHIYPSDRICPYKLAAADPRRVVRNLEATRRGWGEETRNNNNNKNAKAGARAREAMQTYVKTKNKVVDPTRSVAAVDTGMYLVGLNLFPALLGIL